MIKNEAISESPLKNHRIWWREFLYNKIWDGYRYHKLSGLFYLPTGKVFIVTKSIHFFMPDWKLRC